MNANCLRSEWKNGGYRGGRRRREGGKKGRREEGKKGRREGGKKGRREEGKKGRRRKGRRLRLGLQTLQPTYTSCLRSERKNGGYRGGRRRREEGKKGRREEGKKGRREGGKKGRREEGGREEGWGSGYRRYSRLTRAACDRRERMVGIEGDVGEGKKGRREGGKKGRREEGKEGRREGGKKGRREEGGREEGWGSGYRRYSRLTRAACDRRERMVGIEGDVGEGKKGRRRKGRREEGKEGRREEGNKAEAWATDLHELQEVLHQHADDSAALVVMVDPRKELVEIFDVAPAIWTRVWPFRQMSRDYL